VVHLVSQLPAARTLDVACGSGFLTRHLRGVVVGVDQSAKMVALTQSRLPQGVAMVGDGLGLPFADRAFDRVITGTFTDIFRPMSVRPSWPKRADWRAS
jgi:ubiquinone/menaquinone biosynthesis C-methylase UbiE